MQYNVCGASSTLKGDLNGRRLSLAPVGGVAYGTSGIYNINYYIRHGIHNSNKKEIAALLRQK